MNTIPKPRTTYAVNSLIHQTFWWMLLTWSLYFVFKLKTGSLNINIILILKQNIPSRKHVEIYELYNLTIQNQEEEITKRPDTET